MKWVVMVSLSVVFDCFVLHRIVIYADLASVCVSVSAFFIISGYSVSLLLVMLSHCYLLLLSRQVGSLSEKDMCEISINNISIINSSFYHLLHRTSDPQR